MHCKAVTFDQILTLCDWITRFRSAKTVEGEERVIIPGDPERELNEQRIRDGIPLNPKVVEDLKVLGARFSVDF